MNATELSAFVVTVRPTARSRDRVWIRYAADQAAAEASARAVVAEEFGARGVLVSVVAKPGPRSFEQLKALYLANAQSGAASTFAGFSTEEIAAYNRRLMFGENDAAFPSPSAWSRIVD